MFPIGDLHVIEVGIHPGLKYPGVKALIDFKLIVGIDYQGVVDVRDLVQFLKRKGAVVGIPGLQRDPPSSIRRSLRGSARRAADGGPQRAGEEICYLAIAHLMEIAIIEADCAEPDRRL
jgi:hypothetical protein